MHLARTNQRLVTVPRSDGGVDEQVASVIGVAEGAPRLNYRDAGALNI